MLEDLWEVIDERFPIPEIPTALERERMEHEAFAAARRKVYIGREEYFGRLDEHVAGDGPPLVLLGESGSGKSALIANWAQKYREKHPDDFMVMHFIGSTPDSADYVDMLRRIMNEIKERYEPKGKEEIRAPMSSITGEEEIPTDPKKVVETFPLWLAKAAARGNFILVLDALNQLEDRDNAPDLGWLPEYFPSNIRVILSTLPGRSLDALDRRKWQSMNVTPLFLEERRKLIPEYLKQFTKELSKEHLELIVNAEQTANPLYLKALLDEMRFYGDHLTLVYRINYYLSAKAVDDLYEKILERYEEDYERDRPGLVREAMTLIWAARRGLSETELLELLGSDDKPLQRAYWSPLYLAAEESFVSRSGLLNFFHDFLRKAVEDRYLYDSELKRKAYHRLADYFDKKELDDRKVDEFPWQLCQAESWERLQDCITDLGIFLGLMTEEKRYELIGYWLAIENRFDMVEAYHTMLNQYEAILPSGQEFAHIINQTAIFLYLNAKYKGAEPLYRRALAIREKVLGPEHPDTASSINNLAGLLYSKGDYEGAEPLYRRALAIREKVLGPEHPDTIQNYFNLAQLLRDKGKHKESASLYRRIITICERLVERSASPNPALLWLMAVSHNNIAFHTDVPAKNWKEAEHHYIKSIELFKKLQDTIETANVELNLQTLYWLSVSVQKVDLNKAKKSIQILEEAGDRRAEKGHKLLEKLS